METASNYSATLAAMGITLDPTITSAFNDAFQEMHVGDVNGYDCTVIGFYHNGQCIVEVAFDPGLDLIKETKYGHR